MYRNERIRATVEVVKAYVTGNTVPVKELPRIIKAVGEAMADLGAPTATVEKAPLKPSVAVRKSVTRGHIVCLEDGKKFKTLKRHLRAAHGLTPEVYREKWGLEDRYPMVAPAYSAKRSKLAGKIRPWRYERRRPASPKADERLLKDAA